ncbi:hypothetical protein TNCV_2765911 [Trichonephila clavipes]|nr:hypothetical protein TNCV_2765911 [Trichonephila clavipes]
MSFMSQDSSTTSGKADLLQVPEDYDKLPVISSEELYHIKRDPGQAIGSSRLGCQIRLAKNMEGMEVRLPERTGPGWSEE